MAVQYRLTTRKYMKVLSYLNLLTIENSARIRSSLLAAVNQHKGRSWSSSKIGKVFVFSNKNKFEQK